MNTTAKGKKKPLNMCSGPLLPAMLRFSLPLIATGVLSQLYNAADSAVAGRFAGASALGAVGATTTLCWLLTESILGLSVGTSVRVANACGAGKENELSDTVHTSVLLGLIVGLIVALIGILGARTFLIWMDTPEDILDDAVTYLRIFLLGLPVHSVYMFAAAALRATGETRYPLIVLLISGALNVVLNVVTVAALDMGVRGVAWATVASQLLSAVMVLEYMRRLKGGVQVDYRRLRITGSELRPILQLGIPAAIQSALFSFSNVVIQSGVNSFGSAAVAGSSAGSNIESMIFLIADSMGQTATVFAGQNVGAKQYRRVPRVLGACTLLSTAMVAAAGGACCVFREQLVSIFNTDPEVIRFGAERLLVQLSTYTLVAVMNSLSGLIRGLGYSMMPTIVSLVGVCALRMVWVYTVFPLFSDSFIMLMMCFPVTWFVTAMGHLVCYLTVVRRKLKKEEESLAQ